jgi:opacity protein-like surface antigen
MVGAKYYFTPGVPFYGIAQIGFQIFNANASSTTNVPGFGGFNVSASGSSTEFAFAVGAGYEIPVGTSGAIDVTGTFNLVSNLNYIGARVGYRFSL